MALNGVTITKASGRLGRRNPSDDMVSGLVLDGVSVSGGAQIGTVYTLKSVTDAEAIGLNAAYDTTNTVLVHQHISDFFRLNPDGELLILLLAQTVTLTQACDKVNVGNMKKLLVAGGGRIKQVGVVRNPAAAYTPTLTGGLDGDVLTAITKAQQLAAEELTEHRPVHIIIEGRSYNASPSSATDLRGLTASDVSVCIGQDFDVANNHALHNGHASVGALLGSISARPVSQSPAWVEVGNIQSVADEAFIIPALSSHLKVSSYTKTELDTLHDKGYIFPITYAQYSGVFWNDSHACTLAISDYAHLENSRAVNKAVDGIYQALLPFVSGPLQTDPATGKLSPVTAKTFEQLGRAALEGMQKDGDITDMDVLIPLDQNVLATSVLQVQVDMTPLGVGRKIQVTIGFRK